MNAGEALLKVLLFVVGKTDLYAHRKYYSRCIISRGIIER